MTGKNGQQKYRVTIPDGSSLYDTENLSCKERKFVEDREQHVLQGLKKLLDLDVKNVPTIGVLGSGGGFRAAVGFCGVMNGLYKKGLLDVVTYVASLSGSTWYLSQLYSSDKWPRSSPKELSTGLQVQLESDTLAKCIEDVFFDLIAIMSEDHGPGQPSTLVDAWAKFLAVILEPQNQDVLLSSQVKSDACDKGKVPFPMYSAVIVKDTTSAEDFNEWVEFTPYEMNMPKYGVSIDLQLFDEKMQDGIHHSNPGHEEKLSYLQGIWGSAFAILFDRLGDTEETWASIMERIPKEAEVQTLKALLEKYIELRKLGSILSEGILEGLLEKIRTVINWIINLLEDTGCAIFYCFYFLLELISECVGREGRAAKVFSPLYEIPMTPISPINDDEKYGVNEEQVDMVDGGLAFNLPFPLLLRRKADLILSFDFSSRLTDDSNPFGELKKAEKWAQKFKIPFPKIDESVYEGHVKEVYEFKDSDNPDCPIILHFPLVNDSYRNIDKFDIFPQYSTFKMEYTKQEFERLVKLMDYNVCHNLDTIKKAIRSASIK